MDDNKIFIIAEAGVNHNGSIDIAKKLIGVAAAAKADAIKFQTFNTEQCVAKNAFKANYQLHNSHDSEETQFTMLKKLEFDAKTHSELQDHCRIHGILFLSSAFDLDSIDLLVQLGLSIFKIPSGEIDNLPYLRKIAKFNKKIILSTGMSTLAEIENALHVLTTHGTDKNNITVLQCNTEYPTPLCDANLNAMLTIKKTWGVAVGYSDHTLGIEVSIAAAALGARVIEKHFTLDSTMPGPDHKASLNPDELKAMVKAIRNIELALGDGKKTISQSEAKNRQAARKSIVANTPIKKNELFNETNLAVKRPGTGRSPMQWDSIIGQPAAKDYLKDELI